MDPLNHNSRWISRNLIGKGSYGTVSLGFRESDGSFFAVKSADKDSPSSVKALENEIEVLRSLLPSPFIVKYYGDDETSSYRNLLMEYVSGGDVSSSGAIADVELIRSYAWCLVKALKIVHSHGIVHCDVKGSNVLFSDVAGVSKLADFGSAKRIEEDDRDRRSRILPRGSPLWMAPEVVRGESQGFESDIWSFGCTVIEMFTGKPAWQDRGAYTLYEIGYSNELPEFMDRRISDQGRDFLEKCLDRDPRRRWSCDQLLEHPFLLPAPADKITESSPRSVLDNWQEIGFTDVSDDDHELESDDFDRLSAIERIGRMETNSRVNWESDGWVEVRSLRKEEEEEDDKFEIGTNNSEYSNVDEGKEVITEECFDDLMSNCWENDDKEERGSGGGRCGSGGDERGAARREKIETVVDINLVFLLFLLYSPAIIGFKYDINNKNTNELLHMIPVYST